MDRVYAAITRERAVQEQLWPNQRHHPETWLVILTEEVGEVARAILTRDPSNLRLELTQVAAVTVAMLEALDKGELG